MKLKYKRVVLTLEGWILKHPEELNMEDFFIALGEAFSHLEFIKKIGTLDEPWFEFTLHPDENLGIAYFIEKTYI